MKPSPLLVVLALLAAGCVAPEDPVEDDSAVAPAAVDGLGDAEEEPRAASATPPADDGGNRTAETSTPPPPSTTPEAPGEPAAPEPLPYNVSAAATLGWAAGFGAPLPDEAPAEVPREQGTTDATHCPDATLVVPEGATTLTLSRAGDAAQPDAQGAGLYSLRLTAPDGTVTTLDAVPTLADNFPHAVATPAPGTWLLHVTPVGPAVGALWAITAEVVGASLVPPASLAFATACGPA